MTVFDELKARGLIAQVTDEEEIKEADQRTERQPSTSALTRPQTACMSDISWRCA